MLFKNSLKKSNKIAQLLSIMSAIALASGCGIKTNTQPTSTDKTSTKEET